MSRGDVFGGRAIRPAHGVHPIVVFLAEVQSPDVKPLGTAILHMPNRNAESACCQGPSSAPRHDLPSECIFPRKEAGAVVTPVVAFLHVYALVVPLKIRLPHKLLVAVVDGAGKGVFSLVVVGLHMRLEVITAAKELSAAPDFALEICLFPGRVFA